MDIDTFSQIIEYQMGKVESTLATKNAEYHTDDHLHNFRVAANLQGVSLKKALAGMMAKHTISVYDMCASDEEFDLDKWDEKITDHINYLFLLAAVVRDGLENRVSPAEANTNNFFSDEVITALTGLTKINKAAM